MLIIPVSGKIGLKNPPLITLALIVINCLIYFLFQFNDGQAWIAAEQFYEDSGLADIEAPRYVSYLEDKGGGGETYRFDEEMDTYERLELHFQIEADVQFLKQLLDDRIITPKDPQYEQWQRLRKDYEELRNKNISHAYGLRPGLARAPTFFTYMFLHGGVGHLFGNMVFLWILGCMLEMGAGRRLFTIIYLASGLLASGSFYIVYSSNTIPLVGASGAIAGLMGAYTVLYGKTKVNVFYSLGVYFDTAKIPAIILLPAWLVNEGYQLFFSGAGHVAYVAHIGGIVAGAALAFAGGHLLGTIDQKSFEDSPDDNVGTLMHQGLEYLGNLEMRQAQGIFEKILELSPDNQEALMHLFNIHKLRPDSKAFHAIAQRRLQLLLKKSDNHQAVIACYETYASLTRRPVLSVPLYLAIAGAMTAEGHLDTAEKIVLAVLRNKPEIPSLPAILIRLSRAFQRNGQLDQSQRYRNLVCQKYPDSVESSILLRSDQTG